MPLQNGNHFVPVTMCYSPGAKMGTWKCLRVQGFMIDPESISVLKKSLVATTVTLGNFFLFAY